MYVTDVAKAFLLASSDKGKGEIFNLGLMTLNLLMNLLGFSAVVKSYLFQKTENRIPHGQIRATKKFARLETRSQF